MKGREARVRLRSRGCRVWVVACEGKSLTRSQLWEKRSVSRGARGFASEVGHRWLHGQLL